ncbi:hypothetical protein TNCV_1736761 [Trichonephila clavipes]|nr:hypothetical protein TNCV_1736761 [Trichonephila clavipes]
MERNVTEGQNIPVMGVQQETSGLYANRSSRIVTGGKVRAAKCVTRKSHTCSMRLRFGDRVGQSIRSIYSLSKSCSAATCDDMVHCRPFKGNADP